MKSAHLPADLIAVIGTEKIDFSVSAQRSQPTKKSLGIIIFGLVWLVIPVIGSIAFFGPLLRGEEVHFETNDQPTVASLENFEPMLVPSLLLLLFLCIGFGMILWGFVLFFKRGGYFIGTANRLIRYYKGTIHYYDWEQFTGNAEMNIKKGDITLELRRGKMQSQDKQPDKFVPEQLFISGISNVLEVEKICRQRIKENDPNPTLVL